MEIKKEEESEIIDRKIQAIYTINEEIIQRINDKVNSDEQVTSYQYQILPEPVESAHQPHRFKVEEIQISLSSKLVVNEWRVPASAQLPVDPDPGQLMYALDRDLMDMTCQKFSDLVRINQQLVVAKRYTSMLRDSISIPFGLKFKENFELLQVLLGMLESQLQSTESTLAEKQESVSRVNDQMAQIFAENNCILSRPPYLFAGSSRVAVMPTAYQINKGTLLSTGVHRWKVRCLNVVASYDLGVASPSHMTHFGINSTAWGIRESGYTFPGGTNNSTRYKTGDILSFVLNCPQRSLTISINDRQVATIPNVVLPVHIAFSGGAQASAEILEYFV